MQSPFRILLVPEGCELSLYCVRQLNFLSRPWVDYIISYREQGGDLVFIMYAIIILEGR